MSKILTGKVVSCGKMAKTVKVRVDIRRPHPLYKKIVKKSKKFLAHLEGLEVKVGDVVKIGQTRPRSRLKHFRVLQVEKVLGGETR